MNIIITGATGLVGAEVIREALQDEQIDKVTAITRKPINIDHPKLSTIIHTDFLSYDSLKPIFQSHDACIWALGVSQFQVSKEEYITITHDYILAAAKAMFDVNPHIHLLFVSGEGADQSEKSNRLFANIKGRAEKDLLTLPFEKLTILRPAGIRPINKNPNAPTLYKLLNPIYPALEFLFPKHVIKSTDLAKAIITLAKAEESERKTIIGNKKLKEISHKS